MGSVRIETYNLQLMNISDYYNLKTLKKLYKNYNNLSYLAQAGDSVAASVFIDLKTALDQNLNVLTEIQRHCIVDYYVHNYTLKELAYYYDRDESTVLDNINAGIKRIQKALINGSLYKKEVYNADSL